MDEWHVVSYAVFFSCMNAVLFGLGLQSEKIKNSKNVSVKSENKSEDGCTPGLCKRE